MPCISSGDVSSLTRIVSSPLFFASEISFASKYIFPVPAPGDAAKPVAIAFAFFKSSISKLGCNNCSSCLGSTLSNASSFEIMCSFTKSTAIFIAAVAVLLPFLVCNM